MENSQELQRTALRDIVSFSEGVSTIKDIINLVNNTKGFRDAFGNQNKLYSGSIAKRAANLILVFPVIVSSSIGITTAMMISKAIERKCVSMLQLLFSAINLTSYKDTKDLYDYIAKFHRNLDVPSNTMSLDDFIRVVDTIGGAKHENVVDPKLYERVMTEMKQLCNVAITKLNEHSVNDYAIRRSPYGKVDIRLEASKDEEDEDKAIGSLVKAGIKAKFKEVDPSKQVIGAEKANELMPTMMAINFTTFVDGVMHQNKGIIGVKAKFYPVDGTELRGRLSKKFSDSNSLFNLIRASTGEISFWKDLVFAFDKLKSDAVNIAKGSTNSKLFNMLQRRADKNKSRFFNTGNNNPITTLVISQEEVEDLKKHSNVDLTKSDVIKVIFDGFNLMGLVIVDDSIEAAKFLFDDGSNAFETISYTALARESKDQGTINKVMNILQKGGRV